MSHRPTQRPAISLMTLAEKKALGEPIVMVTAYDFPSAQVAEEAGVDVVLVGDSGAMTVLGYPSTVPVKTDELLMLAQATSLPPETWKERNHPGMPSLPACDLSAGAPVIERMAGLPPTVGTAPDSLELLFRLTQKGM